MYTALEKRLLSVRPGITDYASIVFSDEGDILKDRADPDIAYNQLIRPYKGQLGLFYIERSSLALDLKLIALTAVAIVSRPRAELIRVASRQSPLQPAPPPGAEQIVTERY